MVYAKRILRETVKRKIFVEKPAENDFWTTERLKYFEDQVF